MDRHLRSVAADWRTTQGLGRRLAVVRRAGVSGRGISRRTLTPEATVQRWASRS